MREQTSLWIWKAATFCAVTTSIVLAASGPEQSPPEAGRSRANPHSHAAERGGPRGRQWRAARDVARLATAVDQARTPEARCAALARLSLSGDLDGAAIHHIASYSGREHRMDVRICATAALGNTQSEDALTPLLELMDDPMQPIAEAALLGLMELGYEEARRAVLDAATSTSDMLRLAALRALAAAGDPDALRLIGAALQTAGMDVQEQLIAMLGTTRDPDAARVLYDYLKNGPRRLQHAALMALGTLGGARAEAALMEVVQTIPALAPAACHALAQHASEDALDVLIEAAEGAYGPQLSAPALQALTQRYAPQITELMLRMVQGPNVQLVGAAAEYLANHGVQEALPALAALARQGGPNVWMTVHALARIGGPAALDTLAELATGHGHTAQAALQALSSMSDGKAAVRRIALAQLSRGANAPQLLELLARDGSQEAQAAILAAARGSDQALSAQALAWLGQRRDPESLETLERFAGQGRDPAQRASALRALAQTGHPSARVHLEAALQDESAAVRAQAVQVLAENVSADLEPLLLAATRDSDPNVVATATFAAAQLGTPGALARLEELARSDGASAPQALHALMQVDPRLAQTLAQTAARDGSPQKRLAAVQVAAMVPGESSTRILLDAVRSEDAAVVREAIGHLRGAGVPENVYRGALTEIKQRANVPEDLTQMADQLLGDG